MGACGKAGGHTPVFWQIIIKSALKSLEYIQTKIIGAANHPRQPQNQASPLYSNIFLNVIYLFFGILRKNSKNYYIT